MKTTFFENEAKKQQKKFRKAISFLSAIYGSFVLLLALLWGLVEYLAVYPTLIGTATLFHSIILLFIISSYKSFKKKNNAIASIIEESELADLHDILFDTQQNLRYRKDLREHAFLLLFENAPVKTMNKLCINLEEDLNNEVYNSEYLEYLKKYKTTEEQRLIYDYLFGAILNLQKVYVNEYGVIQAHGESSYNFLKRSGYYAMNAMNALYRLLGFDSIDHFMRSNVVLAFKIIFKDLEPGVPANLDRIAQLSRSSENVARNILLDLLELYPELGDYKEFEMLLIPSKAIVNFDTIVDFDSFIHPLE